MTAPANPMTQEEGKMRKVICPQCRIAVPLPDGEDTIPSHRGRVWRSLKYGLREFCLGIGQPIRPENLRPAKRQP